MPSLFGNSLILPAASGMQYGVLVECPPLSKAELIARRYRRGLLRMAFFMACAIALIWIRTIAP